VLEDTSWPPKKIKYPSTIVGLQIAKAPATATPTPSSTPSTTPLPTEAVQPQVSDEVEINDNHDKILLYILIFGVIMIVSAGIIFVLGKKKANKKRANNTRANRRPRR